MEQRQQSRPLDALNVARNKRVIVELKNNKQYIGNLKAFDIHINTVLEEAEEYEIKKVKVIKKDEDGSQVETFKSEKILTRKLGTVFIRGDTITIISPA